MHKHHQQQQHGQQQHQGQGRGRMLGVFKGRPDSQVQSAEVQTACVLTQQTIPLQQHVRQGHQVVCRYRWNLLLLLQWSASKVM